MEGNMINSGGGNSAELLALGQLMGKMEFLSGLVTQMNSKLDDKVSKSELVETIATLTRANEELATKVDKLETLAGTLKEKDAVKKTDKNRAMFFLRYGDRLITWTLLGGVVISHWIKG